MGKNRKILKEIGRRILKYTPFYPDHMGEYIRNLYFWRCVKKLPVERFIRILDAGCGEGGYAKQLAIKYPHLKIDAYDIKRRDSWDNKSENVNFKQKDLLELEEESYYDFCLSIDVLEHILENQKVLNSIYRALKSGGYFYLHMPGKFQERVFPKRFFREFDNRTKEEHVGEMYTLEELVNIMSSIGFKIFKACETFNFFGKIAWEVDRITDKWIGLKIFLMPLLKLFAHLDLYLPKRKGNGILILVIKK